MANITRLVTRNIPAPRQYFTSADSNDNGSAIVTGDIFKIETSLHGPATEAVIITTTAGSMSFRTNSVVQVFPHHPAGEFLYSETENFIASGQFYTDQSQTPIVVAGNSTMILTGPIKDLEVCSVSGAFSLRVKR